MEVGVGSWVEMEKREGQSRTILALDTSTERAVVAISRAVDDYLVAPTGQSPRHGRGLISTIRELLRFAEIRPQQLGAIGVGLGPGSFTGLRIGLTAAKTLAYAVGCPLYGFDSLQAIAQNAPTEALRIVAIGDAQRGDLFVANFARDCVGGSIRQSVPTRLERAEIWSASLEKGSVVMGPGLGRFEPAWPQSVIRTDPEDGYPSASVLIDLTRKQMGTESAINPWFLEPSYIRRSAAEEKAWPMVRDQP